MRQCCALPVLNKEDQTTGQAVKRESALKLNFMTRETSFYCHLGVLKINEQVFSRRAARRITSRNKNKEEKARKSRWN